MHVRQYGDVSDENVLDTLPTSEDEILARLLNKYPSIQGGQAVTVCHSVPSMWFGEAPGHYAAGAQCPPTDGYARERLNIGRAMFETDSLPPGWADKCNQMDEIWVPSKWGAECFARAGVDEKKLFVVPEAVDTEGKFNPANIGTPFELPPPQPMEPNMPPLAQLLQVFGHTTSTAAVHTDRPTYQSAKTMDVDKAFKFLSIFKWHKRKGVDVLIRAYCEEFRASESVILYVKTNTYNVDPKSDLEHVLTEITRDLNLRHDQLPAIKMLDEWIPDTRLPALYAAADAFVLPSRGEGWGLPQAEAMAMGLPTIVTDWSGTTEFANKDNSLPVKYTLKELNHDDMEDMYSGAELQGHRYAEPSISDLRAKMRWVFNHPREAATLGHNGRESMRRRFSPKAVRQLVLTRLHDISKLELNL